MSSKRLWSLAANLSKEPVCAEEYTAVFSPSVRSHIQHLVKTLPEMS